MGRPFPEIPFIHSRRSRQFFDRHRSFFVQSLIQTERIAHLDQSYAYRATQIIKHLADELMQFSFVHFPLPVVRRAF